MISLSLALCFQRVALVLADDVLEIVVIVAATWASEIQLLRDEFQLTIMQLRANALAFHGQSHFPRVLAQPLIVAVLVLCLALSFHAFTQTRTTTDTASHHNAFPTLSVWLSHQQSVALDFGC